jgi:hypothetical protein
MINNIRFPLNDVPCAISSLSGEESRGVRFGAQPVCRSLRTHDVRNGHLEMKR